MGPTGYQLLPYELRLEISRHLHIWRDLLSYRHTDPINLRLLTPKHLFKRFPLVPPYHRIILHVANQLQLALEPKVHRPLFDFVFQASGIKVRPSWARGVVYHRQVELADVDAIRVRNLGECLKKLAKRGRKLRVGKKDGTTNWSVEEAVRRLEDADVGGVEGEGMGDTREEDSPEFTAVMAGFDAAADRVLLAYDYDALDVVEGEFHFTELRWAALTYWAANLKRILEPGKVWPSEQERLDGLAYQTRLLMYVASDLDTVRRLFVAVNSEKSIPKHSKDGTWVGTIRWE